MKLSNFSSYCVVIAYLLMTVFQFVTIPLGWKAVMDFIADSDSRMLKLLLSWHGVNCLGILGVIFMFFTVIYPLFLFRVLIKKMHTD